MQRVVSRHTLRCLLQQNARLARLFQLQQRDATIKVRQKFGVVSEVGPQGIQRLLRMAAIEL